MLYTMAKPSKNMLLSNTELGAMIREQQEEIYNKDQEAIAAQEAAVKRERDEFLKAGLERDRVRTQSIAERAKMLDTVKESLVSTCLLHLYTESTVAPLTNSDEVVASNLVNKFVKENGAWNLVNSFAGKNLLLSEFSRICTKYYDRVVNETCNKSECDFNQGMPIIPGDVIDDFYYELQEVDVTDASKMIKDRVSDAITDFIDTNAANKVEYEDILNQAKEKINSINGKDDALAESYLQMAKRQIVDKRNHRDRNVFDYMVEALTMQSFKDKSLGEKFIHEANVDMDGIVNAAQLVYTMLEMVNTTEMIRVDENFISEYLKNL